ncbi:MAG: DUF4012 domain-containing protein [Candidatus Levyibacteriota bacterium]
MDGFEKINLDDNTQPPSVKSNEPVVPAKINMTKKKSMKLTRNVAIGVGVLIVLAVLFVFGVVFPAIKIAAQAKKTYSQAREVLAAAKKENIELASTDIVTTKANVTQLAKDIKGVGYLAFIPVVNWYYNDANHLVQAGVYGVDAVQTLVDSIKPYADVLGLKGQGSFVLGSAQDRIRTAVTTMSKITPNIDTIASEAALAQKEIDQVNPSHYPPFFGGQKVRDLLTKVKTYSDEGLVFVTQARPLVKVLPELLGEPTAKNYLILFQNDKELRATGGFLTEYAIFRIEHGVIQVDTANDIYTLDATVPNKPTAPRPILAYLPKVNVLNLRDSNLSPDFVSSMDEFNKLYQTAGSYKKVDGIIAVDTYALVSAMNVLGDMTVDGTNFTTKTDPRCNCAGVIYQLEAIADQPVGYVKDNRKGPIIDLMYAIMQKAFSSSPRLYWGPLFQAMINDISQKHILFDMYNTDAQSGIEALNAAGRIQAFDGDYLHVNDVNFGGAKSNLYLTESVTQNYSVQGDGTIQKTVTINYKNPFQPSDCNLERGGLCLNAVQRDWLRVYVPKGSKLVNSQGSEVKVTSYDELGKTVFEGFLTVRPLGTATYTLTYTLPFKLTNGSPLPLLIQKQPGTDKNQYELDVNGHQVDSFPLLADIEKKIKL